MSAHVHISIIQALINFLMFIPFLVLWRLIAFKNADNSVGQAMGTII